MKTVGVLEQVLPWGPRTDSCRSGPRLEAGRDGPRRLSEKMVPRRNRRFPPMIRRPQTRSMTISSMVTAVSLPSGENLGYQAFRNRFPWLTIDAQGEPAVSEIDNGGQLSPSGEASGSSTHSWGTAQAVASSSTVALRAPSPRLHRLACVGSLKKVAARGPSGLARVAPVSRRGDRPSVWPEGEAKGRRVSLRRDFCPPLG